jgi:hypothetical protein
LKLSNMTISYKYWETTRSPLSTRYRRWITSPV